MEENMSVKDFKEYCKNNDDNVVDSFDTNKFSLKCKKCNSNNVKIINTINFEIGGGCPTCGSWLESEGAIIIKCCDCGNSISIIKSDDCKEY